MHILTYHFHSQVPIHCNTFTRLNKSKKIRQTIRYRGFKFVKMHECLSKGELTPYYIESMHNFKGSHNHTLNEVGLHMKTRVSSIFDLYKSFSYAPVKEMMSSPSGHVPGVDSFLDSLVNDYTNNEEFCGSLLTSIFKAYVVKVDGVPNLKYGTDVLNFFLALYASGNKKEFEFVSGNLCGVSLRRMKTITAKRHSALFIGLSRDEIIDLLLACSSRVCTGRNDPKPRVAFTAGINTTALVKAYELSTSDHAIVGGASPNYSIPVGGLSKEQIFERLKEFNKDKHGPMATEVKVVVVSFHNTPKGMPPFFTLAGHPQTTNENNQFALMAVEACEMAAMKDGNAVLLYESKMVLRASYSLTRNSLFHTLMVVINTCICPIQITI